MTQDRHKDGYYKEYAQTPQRKAYMKEYLKREDVIAKRKAHRDKLEAKTYQKWWSRKRTYNLTKDQYYWLLLAQGGDCLICGDDLGGIDGKWHTDHCHKTGAIRGLLCGGCNRMLGNAKDNSGVLRKGADYLERQ